MVTEEARSGAPAGRPQGTTALKAVGGVLLLAAITGLTRQAHAQLEIENAAVAEQLLLGRNCVVVAAGTPLENRHCAFTMNGTQVFQLVSVGKGTTGVRVLELDPNFLVTVWPGHVEFISTRTAGTACIDLEAAMISPGLCP
jgi:hypothetical protein